MSLSIKAQDTTALDYVIQQIDKNPRKVLSYLQAEKSFDPKFDFFLVSELYECDADHCIYARSQSRWRKIGKEYAVKLFKVYLQRTSKKKHTLTFFASGWLFYEAQLLIKFVQVLESEGRSTDEIEINLIDPAYKSIEEREPTPRDISRRQSIEQFWTIAKRLTSSVKKSTYQPVLKAIIRELRVEFVHRQILS